MRITGIIARWIFILCLPVLLLAASIGLAVNSLWFYKYGFEKYGVGQTTGLSEVELDKAARGLINYFNSDEEYISLSVVKDGQSFVLFNEREVAHLKDVKGLINLDYTVLLWTLGYGLVYTLVALIWRQGLYQRRLASGLLWGGSSTLGLMLAFGAAILLDFDQFFLQFHIFSFANDLWLLNPATDYLIMLFPRGFWFDITVFVAGCTASGALVLGGLGLWYIKKRPKGQTA